MAKCDLCYEFARYEMNDSTFACLESLRSNELDDELSIYGNMVEAMGYLITYDHPKVDSIYKSLEDPLLRLKMDPTIRFRIEEQAIYFYTLYAECYDALDWVNLMISDAVKFDRPKSHLIGIMQKAKMVRCIDENEDVTNYYQDAEKIISQNPELRGLYHDLRGTQYFYEASYPLAVAEYLKAAQFYRELNQHNELMELCFSIADLYSELNTYRKSLVYLNRCKKFYQHHELHDLGTFYNSMGWAFYELGENDSAANYFHKSRMVHQNNSPSNPEIAYPIGNLGLLHRKLGNLDSSRFYSEQAIILFDRLFLPTGIAEAENNLGFTALQEGDLVSSKKHFEKALELATTWNDQLEQLSAHHGLYMLEAESNPREALGHYQKFSVLQNELLTSEDELQALQFEVDLLLDQNEQLIKQLELDSELKSLKIERQKANLLFITLGLLVSVALAGMILFYWLSKRKFIEQLNESNEISQRIISMISHDFRGPLGNIRMMLSLLQEDELEEDEFQQLSTALFRQTTDVSLMYDSFVVWAMSQSDGYTPNKDNLKWSEIVDEAVSISAPIAAMKEITIESSGDADIEMITDRMAGHLILRNLLSNAIKYSHEGSKIEVRYEKNEDRVKTVVQDWGVGIEATLLEKIFHPGTGSRQGTHQEYGSGLGLRLIIQFVSLLEGTIVAHSEEGKGSTFTFDLPLRPSK